MLGGLVEGTWPPESNNDAWLSRPMRHSLGLDLPERRIGLSAHDFAQLLGAREVILSRAAKIAGTPTVPSRFIQRLAAVAGARWQSAVARGDTYLAWARELDRPDADRAGAAARAEAAARGAAEKSFGHRDRALAARSLYDLRQAHSASAAARCRRYRTGRRRARHHHPRRHRRIYPALRRRAAGRSRARTDRAGRTAFRRARGFSGGARLLVAAISPHRALVRALGGGATRRDCRDCRRDSRRDRNSARCGLVQAARHRRPHRAGSRRPLCHPRLQDRRRAQRKASAHRAGAAAHAGSGNAARRRFQRTYRPAPRSPKSPT